MPLAYPEILGGTERSVHRWSERDVILYALSVGMAQDPLDLRELRYAYERDLLVLPSFATVIAPRAGARLLGGLDYSRCVDAERQVRLHKAIPPDGEAVATTRVADVIDKGAAKGALVTRETVLTEPDGALLATIRTTTLARGDGGRGGRKESDERAVASNTDPDTIIDLPTWPSQALFYRLCGDRNPLHADPATAHQAGFERPILHGMCTFGLSCRAILAFMPRPSPGRVAALGARFTKPVYPGDMVRFRLWRRGSTITFDARVEARDVTVLRAGVAELLKPDAASKGDGQST